VLKQSGTTEGTLSFIERFASLTRFVILTWMTSNDIYIYIDYNVNS
jgi:hypothetical protein